MIPAVATAKVSLRLVPKLTEKKVQGMLVDIALAERGSLGLVGMLQAHNAARDNKPDEVLQGLQAVAVSQEAMRDTLLAASGRLDLAAGGPETAAPRTAAPRCNSGRR